MELAQLGKLRRTLRVPLELEDGTVIGIINFYWLPSAITRRTLPQFVNIEDEPLARAQQRLLAAHAKRAAQAQGVQPLTMELLNEQIATRRGELFESEAEALEISAKKLMLLLDPEQPTDLTHNGLPIDPSWKGLADNLPRELLISVTEKVMELVQLPFQFAALGNGVA